MLFRSGEMDIDVPALKESVREAAKHVKKEEDYDHIEAELLKKHAAKILAEKPAAAETNEETA